MTPQELFYKVLKSEPPNRCGWTLEGLNLSPPLSRNVRFTAGNPFKSQISTWAADRRLFKAEQSNGFALCLRANQFMECSHEIWGGRILTSVLLWCWGTRITAMGWVDRLKRFGLVGTVDLNCKIARSYHSLNLRLYWFLLIQTSWKGWTTRSSATSGTPSIQYICGGPRLERSLSTTKLFAFPRRHDFTLAACRNGAWCGWSQPYCRNAARKQRTNVPRSRMWAAFFAAMFLMLGNCGV